MTKIRPNSQSDPTQAPAVGMAPSSPVGTAASVSEASPELRRPRRPALPRGAKPRRLPMFFLTFTLTFGSFLANIERLVLGCIEAEFCKQILVGKLLTRSTRCPRFCTAQHSKCQTNFVILFRIFTISF